LLQGLHVGDQTAVNERVHGESERLVARGEREIIDALDKGESGRVGPNPDTYEGI
jgi:hypothetical protein